MKNNFCIKSDTLQARYNHYHIGRISLDHLRVVKVVTFGGYAKKPDPADYTADVYITPRRVIYYLAYNPESTRFCYKAICEPRGTYPWLYTLTMLDIPHQHFTAFVRRYKDGY